MNSAQNRLKCHTCNGHIHFGHPSHRGILTNTIASLQSSLITTREQLAALRKKKWSKQHMEQHKKDMEALKALEERLARDEPLLVELKRINGECYE